MKYTLQELYQAVKFEVAEAFGEHGMTLPEMWQVVRGKSDLDLCSGASEFWLHTCLSDYRAGRAL